MRLTRFLVLAGTLLCAGLSAPPEAQAGYSWGENVPSLSVGQTWVYDASAVRAEIDSLQLVFMFSSSVGHTYRITTMPYNATMPEDDTVFRQIGNNAIIDDDGGQNAYSNAIWRRTNASNSTGDITNYGFNVQGFSGPLRNVRVIVTRLK